MMGLLTNKLDDMVSKKDFIIATIASQLYSELVKRTPVATGQLKGAWELERDGDDWIITNNMEYATIALAEYISEGKYHQGSKQFPAGIQPIIDEYNRKLQKELSKI